MEVENLLEDVFDERGHVSLLVRSGEDQQGCLNVGVEVLRRIIQVPKYKFIHGLDQIREEALIAFLITAGFRVLPFEELVIFGDRALHETSYYRLLDHFDEPNRPSTFLHIRKVLGGQLHHRKLFASFGLPIRPHIFDECV